MNKYGTIDSTTAARIISKVAKEAGINKILYKQKKAKQIIYNII